MATTPTNDMDFSNAASAKKSIMKLAQLLGRAGQPVVSHTYYPNMQRSKDNGTYREALLTFASGQTMKIRVGEDGVLPLVTLNTEEYTLKESADLVKVAGEMAELADKNQLKYQRQMLRKRIAVPDNLIKPSGNAVQALQMRSSELSKQIAAFSPALDAIYKPPRNAPVMQAARFNPALDDIQEGTKVVGDNGDYVYLRSCIQGRNAGWKLVNSDGRDLTMLLPSHAAVSEAVRKWNDGKALDDVSDPDRNHDVENSDSDDADDVDVDDDVIANPDDPSLL